MVTSAKKMNLTNSTVRSTLWEYLSTYSGKLMVFVSTIILARLLTQEDFGITGYAIVFISFLEVIQGLGVGPALIYLQRDEARTNTAFWLGIGFGLLLFTINWLAAPLAGQLFNDARAIAATRSLGFTFPIYALTITHDALLQKELAFGRKAVPELIRASSKGVLSILFALLGFGAASLIWGQIIGACAYMIATWLTLRWRPTWQFNWRMVPDLLGYGANIVTVNALGIILLNLDYLIIGRFLGATALGIYTLAFRLPELLIKQFSDIIARVVFPTYTKIQHDIPALRRGFWQTMRYVTLVTVPLGIGLALVARPFILAIFSEKWLEAAPVLSLIALYTLLRSLTFNVGDVFKAQGKPGVITKLSVIKLIVLLPGLLWAVLAPKSLVAVAWVETAVALLGTVLNLYVISQLLGVSIRNLLSAWQPALLGSIIMLPIVLMMLWLTNQQLPIVQLLAATLGGAVAYGAALWWLQRSVVLNIVQTLQTAVVGR